MGHSSHSNQTRDWVYNNLVGACDSFAVGWQIIDGQDVIQLIEHNNFGSFFSRVSNSLIRYSAVCLCRVWDSHRESKSIHKLVRQMQNDYSKNMDFIAAKRSYEALSSSPNIDTLKVMRDKMLAHTEGIASDHSNTLNFGEMSKVLDESVALFDEIDAVLNPGNTPLLTYAQDSINSCEKALKDMAALLVEEKT